MTALKWQVDAEQQAAGGWPDNRRGGLHGSEERHGARVTGGGAARAAGGPAGMTGVRPLRETARWRLRQSGPAHPLRCALLYTGVPVLCLVTYVALWTAAMHYGYQKQRLSNQIAQLRIDNDQLQAEVREAQSWRNIVPRAVALGMERADAPEFVVLGPGAPQGSEERLQTRLQAPGSRLHAPNESTRRTEGPSGSPTAPGSERGAWSLERGATSHEPRSAPSF